MSYRSIMLAAVLCALPSPSFAHDRDDDDRDRPRASVQLGPRPFYLVERMSPGPLKERLQKMCGRAVQEVRFLHRPPRRHAAVPGAHQGVLRGRGRHGSRHRRVRRHLHQGRPSRLPARGNDLHTTTNILVTDLAKTCIRPFTPASVDASGKPVPASAECRASALTLQEFRTLKGKMDTFNPAAKTPQEFRAAPLPGAPTSTTPQ